MSVAAAMWSARERIQGDGEGFYEGNRLLVELD
jgi:hypothetical protein